MTRAMRYNAGQEVDEAVDLSDAAACRRAGRVGRDLDRVDRWMKAVRRGPRDNAGAPVYPDGLEPMISFEKSRSYRNSDVIERPSVTEYRDGVAAFLERYRELHARAGNIWPRVRFYTSWNEVNNRNQPTSDRCVPDNGTVPANCPPAETAPPSGTNCTPQRTPDDPVGRVPAACRRFDPASGDSAYRFARQAGRYFREIGRQCAQDGCSVGGGSFTDEPTLNPTYFAQYKRGHGNYRPTVWALHYYSSSYGNSDYGGTRPRTTAPIRAFVRATRDNPSDPASGGPVIWLTEGGGIQTFHGLFDPDRPADLGERVRRANDDLRYALDNFPGLRTRITRMYVYQWAGDRNFDSGLTEAFGDVIGGPTMRYRTRSLYDTFKAFTNP